MSTLTGVRLENDGALRQENCTKGKFIGITGYPQTGACERYEYIVAVAVSKVVLRLPHGRHSKEKCHIPQFCHQAGYRAEKMYSGKSLFCTSPKFDKNNS